MQISQSEKEAVAQTVRMLANRREEPMSSEAGRQTKIKVELISANKEDSSTSVYSINKMYWKFYKKLHSDKDNMLIANQL